MFRFATTAFHWTTVVLVSSLVACSWFHPRPEYEGVETSKPLAIPADLDKPQHQDALRIPSKTLLGQHAKSPEQAASFVLNDEVSTAWARIGEALVRIEGVDILNKAESMKSYEVRYQSETLLIATQADGDKTRVLAIGADAVAQQSGISRQLLTKLKAILSK
jgi:uncharacterized lipoprotein